MDLNELDVMNCISDTSKLVAERQTAELGNALHGAHQAGTLANDVEFWHWLGQNYKCLSTPDKLQSVTQNAPDWLGSKILQGKGYEWDFMTAQRNSLKNLFSRYDAGTSATLPGYDVEQINIITGNVIDRFQCKAYTSSNTPNLKHTTKDIKVVTNSEKIAAVQKKGYETIEYQNNSTINKQVDKRFDQAQKGKATGAYSIKNVGITMAKAGAIGAVIGIGTETIFSYKRWKNNEITTEDYLKEIGKSGAMGGITGAAVSGMMIPVQAAITAAGASSIIGIPIAIVLGVAVDKIVAPAFGRGAYAKQLGEAKFYQSITDMQKPLIAELELSAQQFDIFINEIAAQRQEFVAVSELNAQMNTIQKTANKALDDKTAINNLNSMIDNI